MGLLLAGDQRTAPVPVGLRKKRRRHRLVVLGFLAPWLAGFLLFFAYPFGATFYYSLTQYDLFSPPVFFGLGNYEYMFSGVDTDVTKAAANTAILVALMVPAKVLFALGLAMMLTRIRRGKGFWRAVFYLPALAPPVAATIAFVFLLKSNGPVNAALGWLGIDGPGWFTDPAWSKPSLTILALWGAGDVMIILLAALLDVPRDLYDAADVDGAAPRQKFRFVTLPTIMPVLGFAAITGVIQTLQYFTQAAVAASVASNNASGGQGTSSQIGFPEQSTLTYPLWLYERGFAQNYLGYASAMAMVLLFVAFGLTALLLWRAPALIGGEETA
jgi:multiple sugar transport system permease protein